MKYILGNGSVEDLELHKKMARRSIEFRLRASAPEQTTQFS
jgi:hypothetical protein